MAPTIMESDDEGAHNSNMGPKSQVQGSSIRNNRFEKTNLAKHGAKTKNQTPEPPKPLPSNTSDASSQELIAKPPPFSFDPCLQAQEIARQESVRRQELAEQEKK